MADSALAVPGTALSIVACRHGRFLVAPDDMIGSLLLQYGEWAEDEVALLTGLLRPGDVVVDVGAHIGTFTVAFAKAVGPAGSVIAFEAQRLVFNLLCANVALNGLANVHPHNVVASHEDAQVRLLAVPPEAQRNSGAFTLPGDARSAPGPFATPKARLDGRLAGLAACRLIKLDIEGMEALALDGLTGTLASLRPVVCAETNTAQAFAAVRTRLERLDYRLFWHCPRHFRPDNFRGNPNDLYAGKRDINVIAFPAEDGVPPSLEPARDFTEVAAGPGTG